MNKFNAKIVNIESEGMLHIVKFEFGDILMSMMSLELGSDVGAGVEVVLSVKSTYIALAKEFDGLVSYASQIPATITDIDRGKLLGVVELDAFGYRLESIITRESMDRMNLSVGEVVTMLIKASELSIVEVVSA